MEVTEPGGGRGQRLSALVRGALGRFGLAVAALVVLAVGIVGYVEWRQRDVLPEGLVQANGRIEGDRIVVASKVAGRIRELQVGLIVLLMVMPIVLLSGIRTPWESMPGWLRAVMSFSPLHHYIEIAYGILLRGASRCCGRRSSPWPASGRRSSPWAPGAFAPDSDEWPPTSGCAPLGHPHPAIPIRRLSLPHR